MRRLKISIAVIAFAIIAAVLVWANWPETPLANGLTADRVVVWKSKRQLELYSGGKLLKTYRISLGHKPVGPKAQEGDKRTPEGNYKIELHKEDSSCYRALKVSYPSAADSLNAAKLGVAPGGDIEIHGMLNGLGWIGKLHRQRDWTAGCMAVTDSEIEEIYRAVPDGTSVEIHP